LLTGFHQHSSIFDPFSVNLLGKHPTLPIYHTTGHFQMKNNNGYELPINSNKSKRYAEMKKALLKISDEIKEFNICSSTINKILEVVV